MCVCGFILFISLSQSSPSANERSSSSPQSIYLSEEEESERVFQSQAPLAPRPFFYSPKQWFDFAGEDGEVLRYSSSSCSYPFLLLGTGIIFQFEIF